MADVRERLAAALADRYRIERELGAGGMATVYLAEDLKHNRKVAIKVLKPELAAVLGADRFVQEIATTAALQHPNILPLFDSGEADGFLFYVMPYVEGETLRTRLDRETQLGVDESVKLVSEVADALQYAHEQGVVHRDIKPENILIHAGRPMVADFGIALAVSAAAGGRMTETGLSLGTPHYMSPEQATAEKTITNRSDIYSLGAVLYEMLTGEPPHTGTSAQQIIMKIVTEEVAPVTKIRRAVPPNVAAATGKALEKLPADRFESAKAFADALANPAFRHVEGAGGEAAAARGPWNRLSIALAALAAVLALALLVVVLRPGPRGRPSSSPRQVRFAVSTGADSGVYLGGGLNAAEGRPASAALALSPDGRLLVYAGWKRGSDGTITSQLYERPLDQDHAQAIPGTNGGSIPFFSPDGKWIAFFAGRSLKRVPAAGGNVETLVLDTQIDSTGPPWGASWGEDGAIFYSAHADIYRIPAAGGEPSLVLGGAPDSSGAHPVAGARPTESPSIGRAWYAQPEPLPGGRVLLMQRRTSADPRQDEVVAYDLTTRKQTKLITDATSPVYLSPGHLLFMRRGTLMEVGIDPRRLRLEGQPKVVLQNVMQSSYMPGENWDASAGQVAVSRSGDLAYVPGGTYPEVPFTVERVTPNGVATPLHWGPRGYNELSVSPGGRRVAYIAGRGGDIALYVRDLARGVTIRLNTGAFTNEAPVWSPDGRSIAFEADSENIYNMYRIPADNSGPPEPFAPSRPTGFPDSWSSRGVLAYEHRRDTGAVDIWTLAPGGKPTPFVATGGRNAYAAFSPDGSELAYQSDESGHDEIYVRPYPGPGAAIPVSSGGGQLPSWSRNGRHLYYLAPRTGGGAMMMVADVISLRPFRVSRSRPLIDPWPYIFANYGILPDGSFLVTRLNGSSGHGVSRGVDASLRDLFRVHDIKVILNFLGPTAGTAP